jgi:hypothetical protein
MRRAGAATLLLALGACKDDSPPPAAATSGPGAEEPPLWFVDVSASAGVVAPTWCGRPEKPHILESGGTGVALFDAEG